MTFSRHAIASSRPALLAFLSIIWLNVLTTSRWAEIPGSIYGPKRWIFFPILLLTTAIALRAAPPAAPPAESLRGLSRLTGIGGALLLAGSFFVWFPPGTWSEIPFLDNWPARYQATVDGLSLYRHGVAAGWEWHFLGGYHSSSDVTVTLSALAAVPVALFGAPAGFHLLHLVLLLSIPALVMVDLRIGGEGEDTAWIAAGLVCLTVTGWFSYFLVRSGDTNSLAGTGCVVAALVGSLAAAHQRRWGGYLLVAAMGLVTYCHAGFFVYAALLLIVEAAFYRDRRRLVRAVVAIAAGIVAGLPLTWEAWRYPAYFTFNNVTLEPQAFAWSPFLRKIYYNVEILFLPWRWFNDFTGLTSALLPVLLLLAWRRSGRAAFHAWAALTAVALMRLNTPELGYAFLRPVHLLAVFPAVALAGFLVRFRQPLAVIASTIALCAVYLQYLWMPVPHVPGPRALDPELVDRVRAADGALILLENTFHRDMDAGPDRQTQPTPFPAHLEGLLVPATGKRFYAGLWDGWQWSPFRAQLLSGGAFQGRPIAGVPRDAFAREMRRWGIRHMLVWSDAAIAYLRANPDVTLQWSAASGWNEFVLVDADDRDVVTPVGAGHLKDLTPLGATVGLNGVNRGDRIVVRTNYFPAWGAAADGVPVPLFDHDGQLAFSAPRSGTYDVLLDYPRRRWLTLLAFVALAAGAALLHRSAVATPRQAGAAT